MNTAKFEKQRFGATVAQIHETAFEAAEVQARNDGKFVLTVHNRRGETNLWDDMSVTLEPRHFEMLGSIAGQQPMSENCSQISDALAMGKRCNYPDCDCAVPSLDTPCPYPRAAEAERIEALEAKCALLSASLKRADAAVDRLRSLLLAVCDTIEDATEGGDEMAVVNVARTARAAAAEVVW